jgi:hypothetical protein
MISRRYLKLWSRRPSNLMKYRGFGPATQNDSGRPMPMLFQRKTGSDEDHSFNGRRYLATTTTKRPTKDAIRRAAFSSSKTRNGSEIDASWYQTLMGQSLQPPAGELWKKPNATTADHHDHHHHPDHEAAGPIDDFIPQVSLHLGDGRRRKRVLILCTGGTMVRRKSFSGLVVG